MGIKNFFKNLPKARRALNRPSIVRASTGQPAKSKDEAVLHDTVDLIPIIGDGPNLGRILTNKGNRKNQAKDFFVGLIPILGDGADLALTPDTNIKQFERHQIQPKGKVETVMTGSLIPNAIEKYAGGEDRSIWED